MMWESASWMKRSSTYAMVFSARSFSDGKNVTSERRHCLQETAGLRENFRSGLIENLRPSGPSAGSKLYRRVCRSRLCCSCPNLSRWLPPHCHTLPPHLWKRYLTGIDAVVSRHEDGRIFERWSGNFKLTRKAKIEAIIVAPDT